MHSALLVCKTKGQNKCCVLHAAWFVDSVYRVRRGRTKQALMCWGHSPSMGGACTLTNPPPPPPSLSLAEP